LLQASITVVDHVNDAVQLSELVPELLGERSITLEDQDFVRHR
jgi:hypothetical protein